MQEIEKMAFYHGTDRDAAQAILTCGSRNSLFEEIGAFALGREVRRALLKYANLSPDEDWKLGFAFDGPGMELSSLWIPALRSLEESEGQSRFKYGYFFATLNIAVAYRYAIGNPYRSEFIWALAKSLEVLNHLGDPLPSMVATRYPRVAERIVRPAEPVVLELSGISRDRLLTEEGSSNIDAELTTFSLMQEYSGLSTPAAFRVSNVTPDDIVAAHDLSGWDPDEVHDPVWQPKESQVMLSRQSVQEWLARGSAGIEGIEGIEV